MESGFPGGAYMKETLIKIIFVAAVAVCLSFSAGCHTVHGMGQDIQSAGHAIERATNK
jgi:predicted small secreted protein